MKRIVISVTNDLVTDRRIEKVCITLQKLNYEITLIVENFPIVYQYPEIIRQYE